MYDEVCNLCRVGFGDRLQTTGRGRGFWLKRALFPDDRDDMFAALSPRRPLCFQHPAVMLTVSAAASRYIAVRGGRQGKQRRNRGSSDNQQNRDGKEASQTAIIR
jgi:hypothetical protein